MIIGKLHNGSGLGNMLHRLVAVRVRAKQLGIDYGMVYIDDGSGKEYGFKGKFFLEQPALLVPNPNAFNNWHENYIIDNGNKIPFYDPDFNFIEDNTIIDGSFEDERYWEDYEEEVDKWLKVEHLPMPRDLCVIGFRGGEYKAIPELFLPQEYWDKAIAKMKEINPNMRFEVHTDDPETAREFFPDFKIICDIGINWRSMRYAKYAIIANSSFYVLPRWLNKGLTVAPRYFNRYNIKKWVYPQFYYKRFTYI